MALSRIAGARSQLGISAAYSVPTLVWDNYVSDARAPTSPSTSSSSSSSPPRATCVCLHNALGAAGNWSRLGAALADMRPAPRPLLHSTAPAQPRPKSETGAEVAAQAHARAQLGVRVIAYDRPGHGMHCTSPASQPQDSSEFGWDWGLNYLSDAADELIAVLNALRGGTTDDAVKPVLIGHSDGATIALLAAARAPRQMQGVVAVAPHMWYDRHTIPAGFAQFQQQWQRGGAWASPMGTALYRDHGRLCAPRVKRRWEERWLDTAFQDWDDGAALGGVQCPVLVVHGAEDPFWHTDHARAIVDRLPGGVGRLHVIEGAGHAVPQDAPDALESLVKSFVLEVGYHV